MSAHSTGDHAHTSHQRREVIDLNMAPPGATQVADEVVQQPHTMQQPIYAEDFDDDVILSTQSDFLEVFSIYVYVPLGGLILSFYI